MVVVMFLQEVVDNRYKYYVMAIYDSQTQSKSNRNSEDLGMLTLDFSRNAVTNDIIIVEDVIA